MRLLVVLLLIPTTLQASHPGKDLFLPVAGRATGGGGLQYFTSLWVTNTATEPAHVRLEFLRTEETNPSPTPFAEEFKLAGEETRLFDNVTESTLRVRGLGALRIRSDVPVLAAARIYSKRGEEPAGSTMAVSYTAIPAEFAIGNGESTLLQGVSQSSDFRYNVSIVETVGQPILLRLLLRDPRGALLGRREYALRGHEQRTAGIASLFPGVAVDDGVLVIRGLAGNGKVIAVASLVAAQSADGSAFVMSFPIRRRINFGPEVAAYLAGAVVLLAAAVVALRVRATRPVSRS